MKKALVIALAVVSISFLSAARLAAQETSQPSEDQKIEALKKKQLEIKRQIREELEKQNKALEEELDQIRHGKPEAKPTPTQPLAPQNDAVNTTNHPTTPDTNGDGNATTAAPLAMTSNQTTDCVLILAEPKKYSRADLAVCSLSRSVINRRIFKTGSNAIDLTTEDMTFLLPVLLAQIIRATPNIPVDAAIKSFVLDIEASRIDKQFGADPKSSGTTSLGVKGGIPEVLSWAVENGGAVSSRDGTTVTFRVNPIGFAEALSSRGYVSAFRNSEKDPISKFFRRTSMGFSFDTTRGTNPPTLIGSKQQLSAVSFRYQFVNQRDPRSQRYRQKWDNFFQKQGIAFTNQQTDQLMKLQLSTVAGGFKNQALQKWLDATNVALNGTSITATDLNKNAAIEELRRIIEEQLALLSTSELEKDSETTEALTEFIGAYLPYLKEKKKIMDEISKGTLVTFEYTKFREPNAADLSNLRFVAEKGTIGGIDLTANASLTFFNKRPVGPNVQRIRDFDFSAQLDKKLEDVMGLGPTTLSFTGKYQRLTSNAFAFDGTVLPNTKGDIAAGQIKLTIPIKDSGIKVPFSVTFANRTELVREKEVRGNLGFTFDLDTLFAKFKAFAPK